MGHPGQKGSSSSLEGESSHVRRCGQNLGVDCLGVTAVIGKGGKGLGLPCHRSKITPIPQIRKRSPAEFHTVLQGWTPQVGNDGCQVKSLGTGLVPACSAKQSISLLSTCDCWGSSPLYGVH